MRQQARERYGQARDRADEYHRRTLDATSRAGARAEPVWESALTFVRERPVLAGAIAVAIGASIAAMFPAVRRQTGLESDDSEIIGYSGSAPLPPEELTL